VHGSALTATQSFSMMPDVVQAVRRRGAGAFYGCLRTRKWWCDGVQASHRALLRLQHLLGISRATPSPAVFALILQTLRCRNVNLCSFL